MSRDVTDIVVQGSMIDDELMSMVQCVCGESFDYCDYVIGVYPDCANPCPTCGAKLYFSCSVKVYQIEE
jgi:hypothetical protein